MIFSKIFLQRINAFGLLNPNPLEFLRYLFPFSSYRRIHLQFFNSAHNSAQFFFRQKLLFWTKKFTEIEPDKLASFCFFPLKAEDLAFPVMITVQYTGKNQDKNVTLPKS
jgi:hypothetical protein